MTDHGLFHFHLFFSNSAVVTHLFCYALYSTTVCQIFLSGSKPLIVSIRIIPGTIGKFPSPGIGGNWRVPPQGWEFVLLFFALLLKIAQNKQLLWVGDLLRLLFKKSLSELLRSLFLNSDSEQFAKAAIYKRATWANCSGGAVQRATWVICSWFKQIALKNK